jgi:Fe-S cluster assembly protein SufD
VGKKSDQFDLNINAVCTGRSAKVRFNLYSVLNDKSSVNFNGNMVIEKSAHDADVFLTHRTLLTSPGAKTKAIPGLEIKANDVKAGHAATIGNIDDELLFYLMSRGFDQKNASKVIVEGFFKSQLDLIMDENVKIKASELIFNSLG